MRYTETISIPWHTLNGEKPCPNRDIVVKRSGANTLYAPKDIVHAADVPQALTRYDRYDEWAYVDEICQFQTLYSQRWKRMTLYCKREVVDAIQYTGKNVEQLNEFSSGKVTSPAAYNSSLVPALFHKNGVEQVVLPPGDYLVKRQDGTFYVEKKKFLKRTTSRYKEPTYELYHNRRHPARPGRAVCVFPWDGYGQAYRQAKHFPCTSESVARSSLCTSRKRLLTYNHFTSYPRPGPPSYIFPIHAARSHRGTGLPSQASRLARLSYPAIPPYASGCSARHVPVTFLLHLS